MVALSILILEKKIKRLVSEREGDLNHRKDLNLVLAMTFGLRDILENLNETNFRGRGRIWSPKKQIFLIKEDNFVFLPFSLLAKGKYLILTTVNGKGIHVVTGYKWSWPFGIPIAESPVSVLHSYIWYDKDEPKKLQLNSRHGVFLPVENLDDEAKIRKYQDKLHVIIAKEFFEAFLKDDLNK